MLLNKQHKSILIGCDDISTLSLIIQHIGGGNNQGDWLDYSVNTASRSSDLITAIKSTDPVLVILGFRQNQEILNDILFFTESKQRVIFCFTSKYETKGVSWASAVRVFTYPLALATYENSIGQRIKSVLAITEEKESDKTTMVSGFNGTSANRMSKNLSRYVLELDQKKAMLERIKQRIKEIYPHVREEVRRELQSVVNMIKASNPGENYWEDFKRYFENINPDFIDFLSKEHPSLTAKDLKYCCYLKMNMSNNDITQLLGINQESVRTHKYRLKKKLALSKTDSLETYLKSFHPQLEKSAS